MLIVGQTNKKQTSHFPKLQIQMERFDEWRYFSKFAIKSGMYYIFKERWRKTTRRRKNEKNRIKENPGQEDKCIRDKRWGFRNAKRRRD